MEVTESSVLLLPFTASSVSVARRNLVSDLIEAGVCGPVVTDTALVISELFSNALQHGKPLAGEEIRVAWNLDADSIRVAVSDGGGPTRPELGEPTPTTTGGRGLRIVARLSRRWGTSSGHEGTTVWAEVQVGPQPAVAVPAAALESGLPTGFPASQQTLSWRSTQSPGFRARGTVRFGSWSLTSRADCMRITPS